MNTKAKECKRAEIGVGADIAFNNQEEKGNWADLEKNIKSKEKEIKDSPPRFTKEKIKLRNKLKRMTKGSDSVVITDKKE